MAITNFIPTIWSENLLSSLDKNYITVSHCNRDYEGEIQGKGSRLKICGIQPVSVQTYIKGSQITAPEEITDTEGSELVIDQAKYFNFHIDDIDKIQASPKLMDAAMKNAASALASNADSYVISCAMNTFNVRKITVKESDPESITNAILSAREILYKANVSEGTEVFLEVTPSVATAILKAKLAMPNCDPSTLETGYVGSFAGCKIYVSNNLWTQPTDSTNIINKCIMRTRRAITFAEQISEVVAYRPENHFSDAVKGLMVYGAKVIYPEELVLLDIETFDVGYL